MHTTPSGRRMAAAVANSRTAGYARLLRPGNRSMAPSSTTKLRPPARSSTDDRTRPRRHRVDSRPPFPLRRSSMSTRLCAQPSARYPVVFERHLWGPLVDRGMSTDAIPSLPPMWGSSDRARNKRRRHRVELGLSFAETWMPQAVGRGSGPGSSPEGAQSGLARWARLTIRRWRGRRRVRRG